jgi:hypothetical protein
MASRQRQAKPHKRDGKDASAEQRYLDAVRRARELDIPYLPNHELPKLPLQDLWKGALGINQELGDDLAPCLGISPELALGERDLTAVADEEVIDVPGGRVHLAAQRYKRAVARFDLVHRQDGGVPKENLLRPVLIEGALHERKRRGGFGGIGADYLGPQPR